MVIRTIRFICAICAILWLSSSVAVAGRGDGVILLYGKGGSATLVSGLADALRKNGFAVTIPDLPYAGGNWEKVYEENVIAIDKDMAALKSQGVKRVFIAGHSLGANVALYYATRVKVDGVIAIGPGHVPEAKGYASRVRGDVARARKMVSEGKGDALGVFDDYDQGRKLLRRTTARIYLSYADPEGPAVMPRNAAALKPGTPLLWVVGTRDGMYERGPGYAFNKAPPDPRSEYLVIDSDHSNAPSDGARRIVEWLKAFGDGPDPADESSAK